LGMPGGLGMTGVGHAGVGHAAGCQTAF